MVGNTVNRIVTASPHLVPFRNIQCYTSCFIRICFVWVSVVYTGQLSHQQYVKCAISLASWVHFCINGLKDLLLLVKISFACLLNIPGGTIIHNSQGVAHVNGRLAMTRSLGDIELKPFGVTSHPYIRSIEVKFVSFVDNFCFKYVCKLTLGVGFLNCL